VLLDEVLGPELGEPRVVDELAVRGRERTDGDGDLSPEAAARCIRARAGRAQ
jgi:hypothetical protein